MCTFLGGKLDLCYEKQFLPEDSVFLGKDSSCQIVLILIVHKVLHKKWQLHCDATYQLVVSRLRAELLASGLAAFRNVLSGLRERLSSENMII